jgi:hypothetical protein
MKIKKFLTNFRLGTLFFLKPQLLFYMKIQKNKNFVVLAKKINHFTIGPSNPLRGLTHLGSGSTKIIFFY